MFINIETFNKIKIMLRYNFIDKYFKTIAYELMYGYKMLKSTRFM